MRCGPRLKTHLGTIKQLFAFGCDSSTKICPDGQNPNWLIQSADGNFYGTTTTGGVGNHAGGTVFKISPRQFDSSSRSLPTCRGTIERIFFPNSLVEGNDGFLYGTTLGGGSNSVGVIFRLSEAIRSPAKVRMFPKNYIRNLSATH